jgi:hypothetical protein
MIFNSFYELEPLLINGTMTVYPRLGPWGLFAWLGHQRFYQNPTVSLHGCSGLTRCVRRGTQFCTLPLDLRW